MASSKERVAYVIEQLNIATGGNVSSRAMMGEYVVYYRDKVIGGIYDDRLLVKMLKIENVEDAAAIKELFEAMYPELPARKTKKKQS